MNKSKTNINENQLRILNQILSRSFQEIRILAWEGKSKQAGDLADAFHNIQSALIAKDYWTIDLVTKELSYYQTRHQIRAKPNQTPHQPFRIFV